LLLEEYGVTFEYLPGKKQKDVAYDADTSSCLVIYSPKILEDEAEEAVTFLSGSGNNNISNFKLTSLMHTTLIFK
jgi:hypothetical protein